MDSKRLKIFEQLNWAFNQDPRRYMPPVKIKHIDAKFTELEVSPFIEEVRLAATYFYPVRMSQRATKSDKDEIKARAIEALARDMMSDLTSEIYELVKWMDEQGYDREVTRRVVRIAQLTQGKSVEQLND